MSGHRETTAGAPPRRADVLRAVVTEIESRRDLSLPMDVPGIESTFGDQVALVTAVHTWWRARLATAIAQALTAGSTASEAVSPEDSVMRAWAAAAGGCPGTRELLDHYADHPSSDAMAMALGVATAQERVLLAEAAGFARSGDSQVVAIGAELEAAARSRADRCPVLPISWGPLVRKLRSALPAA